MGSHRDFSFLGKKADLSKSALMVNLFFFGLSTINHSVIKKNGKRDALTLQKFDNTKQVLTKRSTEKKKKHA